MLTHKCYKYIKLWGNSNCLLRTVRLNDKGREKVWKKNKIRKAAIKYRITDVNVSSQQANVRIDISERYSSFLKDVKRTFHATRLLINIFYYIQTEEIIGFSRFVMHDECSMADSRLVKVQCTKVALSCVYTRKATSLILSCAAWCLFTLITSQA
jgi:hypothetical protein